MTAAQAIASPGAHVERAARALSELQLDALLVSASLDVRYVSGFTGSSGLALLVAGAQAAPAGGRASAPSHLFFTDFRYRTQSAQEVPSAFEIRVVAGSLLEAVAAALAPGGGRVGFDRSALTVADHDRLSEHLGDGWEAVALESPIGRLRIVKDEQEVGRMRVAAELADEALQAVLAGEVVGRTERDLAIELEVRMRRLGAEAPSFPAIVAAGAHAALPHAQPRDEQIPPDVLLTIDWGAIHEGYCSDCTRTYATGERISDEAREVYELVLAAQRRGLSAARSGISGRELDAAAREVIADGGRGEFFGHGLGHGVGLDVHEPPRLSRTAPTDPLPAGAVVTIEPGIYLPGRLGVRIEDLVVLRDDSAEVLTSLPKQLQVVH